MEMLNTKGIFELMKEKGIRSVAALSRKTKIPYTTLNYMLSGHDMHVSSLLQLAMFFGVPVDRILNKSYGIVVLKENTEIHLETTNFYEAAMSTMM